MVNKQLLKELILRTVRDLNVEVSEDLYNKIEIEYPDSKRGDYSTNAALILSKSSGMKPNELATKIVEKITPDDFEKIEIAGPGFINFFVKNDSLLTLVQSLSFGLPKPQPKQEKVLVEYFQLNIAKPVHIGHIMTAVIGDELKRVFQYLNYKTESDTHLGDWGTQFGMLILAYKKHGHLGTIEKDPINELNKLYIQINQEIEKDPSILEAAKKEFVDLEKGNQENRKIWKQFVDWSMSKFMSVSEMMGLMPFDHDWPESFYEDKMPKVIEKLKAKGLLIESRGAQIVDLESQGLGVGIIMKSDGGTTYLLRDLATFIHRKSLGFIKQLYVVDSRQSHAFRQLFAILKMLGEINEGEATHIDYGFMSYKGSALSTRKGNMILVEDLLIEAKEKVAKIIEEKNPDLKNKDKVADAVSKAAIKYFVLSHNRHSDIEFDWDVALDFEGNSGPYLQYVYARLSSILSKSGKFSDEIKEVELTTTERAIMVELSKFEDVLEESIKEFLPNIVTDYLYNLAGLVNKFYHESPVLKEPDEKKKQMRLVLVSATKQVYGKGLGLLGITPLEEM